MIMCFLFAYTLVHFHFYIDSYYVTDEDAHDFMLGVLFQIMPSYLSYAGVSFFARATHNLYQLVKRHQKQAAQAEETPDQLNQVYSLSISSLCVFPPTIFCLCFQLYYLTLSLVEYAYILPISISRYSCL